jgi:arylsulfatase B
VTFDGRSLRPLLECKACTADGSWPDRILVTDSQRVKDPIKWRKSAVMTSQWRLINGQELYDIKEDPGQKNDVAGDHPQVVQRLRAFYEKWWAELEPTFKQDCAISLGHEAENPATLTCHDWITTGSTPWNQASIRSAMGGDRNTGFWNVSVVEAGEYEIRLRRWPREAGAAVDAALPPGDDVPGTTPFRARPGKSVSIVRATLQIGDQQAASPVEPGAQDVVFTMRLPAGLTRMSGRFHTANGQEIGTYYAYVKKR